MERPVTRSLLANFIEYAAVGKVTDRVATVYR
jgi:hypothetical protein